MNGKNKRWLEQRWDKRQPERLAHIKAKKEERNGKADHDPAGVLRSAPHRA